MVCLHGKVIVLKASQMFFVALTINIHNIECVKNFFPFSSIPLAISGAQLKEAGYLKKYINFDSGNY